MNPPPDPEPAARWCEDARFVRALAGQLAADPHLADDVAQDAWLRTLDGHAPQAGRFRAWVATVLRNLVASHHRRRARHERFVAAMASDAAAEEPSAAIARLEAHAAVVAAVRTLEEPYRTAILLRWFEGLLPRAIAQRLGVPVRTVHTRLQRAMTQLRARLHERDPRWSAALLVTPWPGATAAALTMTTTTRIGLAAAACAVAVSAFLWLPDRSPAPAPAATGATTIATAPVPTVDESGPLLEREPASEPTMGDRAPADPAPDAETPWALAGVVLDLDARPVADVAVTFRSFGGTTPAARGLSAANGHFALQLDAVSGGHVEVDDPRWTAVYRAVLWGNRDVGELTLVVAPASPVSGTVVDAAGRPVVEARVNVTGTPPPRSRFARNLERALAGEWSATTDGSGAFVLPAVPELPDLQIHATRRGHHDAHAELTTRTGVRLVLGQGAMLTGRVVDEHGRPVAVAVFCHPAGAMSDADGRFSLDLTHVQSRWLVAARGGSLPARLECPGDHPEHVASWPQPIELRLGGPPLAISGRLLAADGTPVPAPSVWAHDPECLVEGNAMSSVEFLARVHSRVTDNGAEFWIADAHLVGLEAAEPSGAFRIGGLQDRSYRLRFELADTLQQFVTEPIAAGTSGLELRLPSVALWPGIAGVVVDRRGQAVAGANVTFAIPADGHTPARCTAAIVTDADGRFARGPLLRGADTVLVQAPGIAWPTRFDLSTAGDATRLRLTAPIPTTARIEATHLGDNATFLAADGTAIGVTITQGDRAWGAADIPLTDGRSEVITVPDDAVTLVLKRAGEEVARIPVDLRPGPVQVLQP